MLKFPYYRLDGSDAQGFVNTDILDYGSIASGADVLVVPLVSGQYTLVGGKLNKLD